MPYPLAAVEPSLIGAYLVAAVGIITAAVTFFNQRQSSRTSKDTEAQRVAGQKQVAEIQADAAVETALVANFANSLTALQVSHDKLEQKFEAEQEKRRTLAQKVADLELELTRKQATIEQNQRTIELLQRAEAMRRKESEEEITALHDENIFLRGQVKLLQEECVSLKAECAVLRAQINGINPTNGHGLHAEETPVPVVIVADTPVPVTVEEGKP